MSIHIELLQEKNILEGPIYQVVTTVNYARGIDRNIFVYETETGLYAYVATVWDMDQWPSTMREAQLNLKDYYRADSATVEYSTSSVAADSAAYIEARVRFLASQTEISDEEFAGSSTITIDEGVV